MTGGDRPPFPLARRLSASAPYPPRTHGAWVNKWVHKRTQEPQA